MGKGRARAVEKGVIGQGTSVTSDGTLNIPSGPVYYPTEEEFKDPLKYIYKIRPEAEEYGICKIVPPKSWKPPFALNSDSFTFPTKTQAIHQLQARCAPCDPKTFSLEYNRFLAEHCGKKVKKRVVFEGGELDLCKLFNAVKRFGGYDKVVKEKKWGEVFRFVRSGGKITECAKHVLCQLYREHLYDYEEYYNKLNEVKNKSLKRGMRRERKSEREQEPSSFKRRRKNKEGERVEVNKLEEEEHDQICEQCQSGLHGEVMLLCDRCNKGWHIYCLSPPLKRVPPGNWYCLDCLNSDKDSFGFVPGKQLSLEAFRRMADRTKKKWFGSASTSRVQLEKKFWEIVEGSVGEVEVMYGSDLDTSIYGSGFPRVSDSRPPSVEANSWEEYCTSPWNLNNLPKLQGSVLRAVHQNITGVMVPWLYVGMLFSSFCWHVEDHCFYSMNYHHWGEPKCWYSVPGGEADAFEKVMRNSLPDLFDAQPDLLFQLVTMLNPRVLQENSVPVYSLLQEPGNFIITFPRSYHSGFNFGLNCAEAVNFAPADWLPHGGFGADLYKLYHKAAVLSHEELLCVVAKNDFDSEVSPYLRKELLRVYNKEKTWRERLWKNGVVNSSPMSPRKQPESVGTEEDPACIICQQFLYLSAVVCQCRPSAFVCLEHWEHLCECKPNKHSLLYRHTLAELSALVLIADTLSNEEATRNSWKQDLHSSDPAALSKKVKGVYKTHVQLAEEWLLRSCKILQSPFLKDVYTNALKEAEQFLWAGPEMDPVQDMVKSLVEARDWAEAVRDCVSKVESWSSQHNHDMEKVSMECVHKLLDLSYVPCNIPGHLKLKEYWLEGRKLIQEIDSALSKSSTVTVADLETLFTKTVDFPIHVKESEGLFHKLSSAKVWADNVKRCTLERSPAMVEADFLYKLEKEILELQLQLPEGEVLSNLIMQVESCRFQCNEILKGSMTLKKVEQLLVEFDGFTVNVVELKLLRQYHVEAVSWISHVNNVLINVHEREDQQDVVDELISIQRDGSLLKIQVEELPRVDIELKRASCRVKACKALICKMSMNFLEKLMQEAAELQIDGEKLFADISGVYAAAMSWEGRAKHLLASDAEMFEFEDIIRSSEDICVNLPSLDEVKNVVAMATSWLNKSKPFLLRDLSMSTSSSSLLEVEALKELVSESKRLKISLRERSMLQKVLKRCTEWEQDACSLLCDAEWLLNIENIGDGTCADLILKIEHQVLSMESVIEAGLSLGFDFGVFPKFQDACSTLHWCLKALSFCAVIPTVEEVEMFLEVGYRLPATYSSCPLYISLIDGIIWLKKSLEIAGHSNRRRFKLSDAEEVLRQSQKNGVPFSLMVNQLQKSIEKHNLWLEQVHHFFSFNIRDRSLASLLQLRELGSTDGFNSSELEVVFSEVQKVEQWKQRCQDILRPSAGNVDLLLSSLSEFKSSIDRSFYMYEKSKCSEARTSCAFCCIDLEDQKLLTCSICKDCFHSQCIGPSLAVEADSTLYTCPYCNFINIGKILKSGFGPLRIRQTCPELSKLTELLTDAEDLCLWIEERTILHQIVEKALECQACLIEIVDFVLAYLDKNLSIVTRKLSVALKAVDLAGVCYSQGDCKLDLALARNSWKVRSQKLLEGPQKPTIQQIQRHLKEGLAISIPSEDYFRQSLTEVRNIGMQWADTAKKVSVDGGALGLDRVFELITEGENLPVYFEKELKLLRERSMLYCICRRPYGQRPMVACDKCDEWYHFDCVNLSSAPKIYICPACDLETEEYPCSSMQAIQERSIGSRFVEPQTPSPRRTELRRKSSKHKSSTKRKIMVTMDVDALRRSSGIEQLLWRNRKPFRRVARKRLELGSLSPFLLFPRFESVSSRSHGDKFTDAPKQAPLEQKFLFNLLYNVALQN